VEHCFWISIRPQRPRIAGFNRALIPLAVRRKFHLSAVFRCLSFGWPTLADAGTYASLADNAIEATMQPANACRSCGAKLAIRKRLFLQLNASRFASCGAAGAESAKVWK